jgi:hypothetical protein
MTNEVYLAVGLSGSLVYLAGCTFRAAARPERQSRGPILSILTILPIFVSICGRLAARLRKTDQPKREAITKVVVVTRCDRPET